MGFLSKLMGHKLVGTIRIRFYGKDEASVEYETNISEIKQKEMDLLQLFCFYYARMLFNLGRGVYADTLIVYIQKSVEDAINSGFKRLSILAAGQKLVEPKGGDVTKVYSGELLEESDGIRIIKTHMSWFGESHYAPVSTIMFLQWLIRSLSDRSLRLLILSLGGMNKYYREQGNYADGSSLDAAPIFGLNTAMEAINGGVK